MRTTKSGPASNVKVFLTLFPAMAAVLGNLVAHSTEIACDFHILLSGVASQIFSCRNLRSEQLKTLSHDFRHPTCRRSQMRLSYIPSTQKKRFRKARTTERMGWTPTTRVFPPWSRRPSGGTGERPRSTLAPWSVELERFGDRGVFRGAG